MTKTNSTQNPQSSRKKVLFLYCELATYFIACLKNLVSEFPVEAHVVRLPVNPVAPINIPEMENVKFYERSDFNSDQLSQFVSELGPHFIFVNGWKDKGYLRVSKENYGSVPTVLTFDNPWKGNLRQLVGTMLGPIYFSKIFSHCWVPGESQKQYALKLGFDKKKVYEGMYSADVDHFKGLYEKYKEEKEKDFPKRILFVGRYTDHKGVTQMWEAFENFQRNNPSNWELWCVGKGELGHLFPKHEKIKDFGFIQPDEMDHYIRNTGVFILPSKFEHWGVVVHEFAASGFPIISSDKTAAANTFLKDNYNGFLHKADDTKSIEAALNKLLSTSDQDLIEMGKRSVELSENITPGKWSQRIWNIIKEQEECAV